MPVKIRLQRHGKKGKPFFWVVAADARAKRDGKFLEKLGTYNPTSNPAQIELNVESSVKWLENGAQPTETAKRILSYKGVLMKHHLQGGVTKGALTQEQADAKFEAWLSDKEKSVGTKKDSLAKAQADAKAKALEAEKEVNEKRKTAATQEEAPAEEPVVEAEATEEAPAVEETPAAEETPVVEEAPATETPVAEEEVPTKEETPSEEAPAAKKDKEADA